MSENNGINDESLIQEDKAPFKTDYQGDDNRDMNQKKCIGGGLCLIFTTIVVILIVTLIKSSKVAYENHPMYDVYSTSFAELDKFTDETKTDIDNKFWGSN